MASSRAEGAVDRVYGIKNLNEMEAQNSTKQLSAYEWCVFWMPLGDNIEAKLVCLGVDLF